LQFCPEDRKTSATRWHYRKTTIERWYRFLARGSKPLYGYGTLEQAFQFAQRLNCMCDIIYSTRMITDEEAQELVVGNTDAFSLTLALAEEEAALSVRCAPSLAGRIGGKESATCPVARQERARLMLEKA
jgi:hypothetical protein